MDRLSLCCTYIHPVCLRITHVNKHGQRRHRQQHSVAVLASLRLEPTPPSRRTPYLNRPAVSGRLLFTVGACRPAQP